MYKHHGLLDADIHGPNAPLMLNLEDTCLFVGGKGRGRCRSNDR